MATPDRGKFPPSTYRFSHDEQALMDRLGARLAPAGLPPLARIDVLRHALARLAEAHGLRQEPAQPLADKAEKTSRKNRKPA